MRRARMLLLVVSGLMVCGWASAEGAPNAKRLDDKPLAELTAAIASGRYPSTTSVLVVLDGRLGFERYFGGGGEGLLNNTRSATKFLTTLALGAAIADGAIPSEHALAFPYLTDLKPFQNDTPGKNSITLQDMLTMSSALACDDNDDQSPGNEDVMHSKTNWTRWAVDLPTLGDYTRDATGFGPWRYCTTNAFLVGQIVQRATRTPVDRYTEDKILRPLGIARWNWSYSPSHEAMTGGGLELRSRDLRAAVVVTRTAFNVRGTSRQTAEMLEKYILPALPCAKS